MIIRCLFVGSQVFYLGIIGITFYISATSSFKYVPGYYVSEVHKYVLGYSCNWALLLFLPEILKLLLLSVGTRAVWL